MKNKYYEAYLSNPRVTEYVDKYCKAHNKDAVHACDDYIVRNFIDYVEGK